MDGALYQVFVAEHSQSATAVPQLGLRNATQLSFTSSAYPKIQLPKTTYHPSHFHSPKSTIMADFAPYQDIPPDDSRAISPPPRNMTSPKPPSPRANGARSPPLRVQSPSFQRGTDNGGDESGGYYAPGAGWQHGEGNDEERGRRGEMDVFETRLGLRMDVEACLSYLALPPVGGVLLLILEHKSDYVRYVLNRLEPW